LDVQRFYERHARRFDRERSRSLSERADLDWLIAPLGAGGTVLDVGCGAGEPIASYLLSRRLGVTGVDASAAMLELFRIRCPGAEAIHADMRKLNLGRRYDALVAWDSFFHLDREAQRTVLAQFARHLRPGARLLFTSGPEDGERTNPLWGDPLFHASLSPGEYRTRLSQIGFVDLQFRPEDPECGGRSVWRAVLGRIAAAPPRELHGPAPSSSIGRSGSRVRDPL
jgi:cyclopropane fatty-acyl-phospholipid synthase-like methyltransferase